MSEQALWGALVMLYIIPAGIYVVRYQSEESVTEYRKKLYPGRVEVAEEEDRRESRSARFLTLWCIGFGLLLIGYKAEWDLVGTAILSLGVPAIALAICSGARSPHFLSNHSFRFWLVGSVVWVLAVWSWYLVFGSHSELSTDEFALLAIMPALISAVGIVAWRWAKKS